MARTKQYLASPLAALGLLLGLGAFTWSRETASDAEPYHARVRQAAEQLPRQIGNWIYKGELPLDSGSRALLRPNVVKTLIYQNMVTGREVQYLLVHCREASDMLGHYPPNCYPGQGFTKAGERVCDLQVGDLAVPGKEYDFVRSSGRETQEQFVYNFMILPDGKLVRDMDGIYQTAKSYRKKFYGAGQIQLVFPIGMSSTEREEAAREFVAASKPVIQTILAGVER